MTVGIELSHLGGVAFLPNTVAHVVVDNPSRLADEPAVGHIVFLTIGQADDLVLRVGGIDADSPLQVLSADGHKVQRDVVTEVLGLTDIIIGRGIACQRRDGL